MIITKNYAIHLHIPEKLYYGSDRNSSTLFLYQSPEYCLLIARAL